MKTEKSSIVRKIKQYIDKYKIEGILKFGITVTERFNI